MYQDEFIRYLEKEKKMAQNTLEAYKRDVMDFFVFATETGVDEMTTISNTDVVSYLLKLKADNKSAATVNRKLASIRAYFNFLQEKGRIKGNPTLGIKSPKIERKELEYLTLEEVDRLLQMPDKSIRGMRDSAILELLYATGIRVNEIIAANVEDVNLRIGFFTCPGEHGKARIIPMGRPARKAVEEYIFDARDMLLKDKKTENALFVNYFGQRMTRQGLWKILKEYADKAGISSKLTPHILRNSFAVHMIQNGADLKSLQDLLGHEDISATQVYLTVTKNRIKDVYDKTHPRA
jgi:integrase/recombinase XerD